VIKGINCGEEGEKWGTCNGLWHRNEVPRRKPLSESKLMIPTQIYGQPDKRKWKKVKEIEKSSEKKIIKMQSLNFLIDIMAL